MDSQSTGLCGRRAVEKVHVDASDHWRPATARRKTASGWIKAVPVVACFSTYDAALLYFFFLTKTDGHGVTS